MRRFWAAASPVRTAPSVADVDGGAVYLEHLRNVLADDSRRYERLLSRAESLTRTVLTTLTIFVALIGYLTRGFDLSQISLVVKILVLLALSCGVASSILSTTTQIRPAELQTTSLETIRNMSSEAWFSHRSAAARFNVINRVSEAIVSIRPIIDSRSKKLNYSTWLAVCFIILTVAAIGAFLITGGQNDTESCVSQVACQVPVPSKG